MISQIQIFWYACILGIIMGIIYDVFRIIRLLINWKDWQIFIQDIVYFFIVGVFTFLFTLAYNKGDVRAYLIAGEIIGWILYYITIGEIVYHFSEAIARFIKKILSKFIKIIRNLVIKIVNKCKIRSRKKQEKVGM